MRSLALEYITEKVKEIGGQCSLDEYEAALRKIASIAQVQYEREEATRPAWRRPRRFATVQAYHEQ